MTVPWKFSTVHFKVLLRSDSNVLWLSILQPFTALDRLHERLWPLFECLKTFNYYFWPYNFPLVADFGLKMVRNTQVRSRTFYALHYKQSEKFAKLLAKNLVYNDKKLSLNELTNDIIYAWLESMRRNQWLVFNFFALNACLSQKGY